MSTKPTGGRELCMATEHIVTEIPTILQKKSLKKIVGSIKLSSRMALRLLHPSSSKFLQPPWKSQITYPRTAMRQFLKNSLKFHTSCSKNSISDAELALDFAAEVEKINSQMIQTEEALAKSSEMLFAELCNFTGLRAEELKHKWIEMSEEERWVLVKRFVSDWGSNFHPLSTRSVKEMVDEFLDGFNPPSSSSAPRLLPFLKKFIGFS